jgi:hypothetical protein
MTGKVITLVKIPISEIEEWIRIKHVLPSVLTEFHIEEKDLVLYFREEELPEDTESSQLDRNLHRKRRAHRKRNRMRTRGWETVARITNSKGQHCAIYKPFADALQNPELTVDEQRKIVEKILRSNRNKPSEGSIQYYLENTLEYLRNKKNQAPQGEVA